MNLYVLRLIANIRWSVRCDLESVRFHTEKYCRPLTTIELGSPKIAKVLEQKKIQKRGQRFNLQAGKKEVSFIDYLEIQIKAN